MMMPTSGPTRAATMMPTSSPTRAAMMQTSGPYVTSPPTMGLVGMGEEDMDYDSMN